jgi:GTP cyclohydrolase III
MSLRARLAGGKSSQQEATLDVSYGDLPSVKIKRYQFNIYKGLGYKTAIELLEGDAKRAILDEMTDEERNLQHQWEEFTVPLDMHQIIHILLNENESINKKIEHLYDMHAEIPRVINELVSSLNERVDRLSDSIGQAIILDE